MKSVLLHGLDGSSKENWFPWLKAELEKLGFGVWAPNLPQPGRPNPIKWTKYLLDSGWNFDDNLVVGHSAGAVEILALATALPAGQEIKTAFLVAPFEGDLGMPQLVDLHDIKLDFRKIRESVGEIIMICSDNDPYIPLENSIVLEDKLGVKMHLMKKMGHFSRISDPRFEKFPELLKLIKQKVL